MLLGFKALEWDIFDRFPPEQHSRSKSGMQRAIESQEN